ncbi:MAG: galactokinase [Oscillospiraceae bacterium]|nr:galactokinase [Oscillospiraceae bacterium]
MNKIYHFSVPGRTELGGNHTDHQHGCVLAAAIDMEMTAQVTLNGINSIRVRSAGYSPFEIDLLDLAYRESEKGTTAALVRGVAAAFSNHGARLHGFDMDVQSNVLPGSGLSSSAAFEVLVGTVLNALFFENKMAPTEIARIGQYAENAYFGKPCGLMDQIACAMGGLVFIDFEKDSPHVERLDFDFEQAGYNLCIIDTGADHIDLTDEYAAITKELSDICRFFGKEYLRQIPEDVFFSTLPQLKKSVSHRAILRAIHVYQENKRVIAQRDALKAGKIQDYLALVNASGQSSWMYLQNIYPTGATKQQPMALALALCDTLLNGCGAYRVHGGGFAGTIQAYIPLTQTEAFVTGIESTLGFGCCHLLRIHPTEGPRLTP